MDKQPNLAKSQPTFEEEQLKQLIKEVKSDHGLAWDIVTMCQDHPALQVKHPVLYLRARQRLSRNQNWFRFGRFLGRCSRVLASLIGKGVIRLQSQQPVVG